MHGENKDEVFDLNAFYSPVGGNWPCVSGNSWYWQWIYNFAYGAYQKLLIYRVSDRWVIRREGGSATFAYCLEAQLDKCNNQWYVEYGVDCDGNTAYILDSDGSFECISNEFCNQPITTTGATTDDYETSNSEEGCAINDENDCVDVRGFWGNLWTGEWDVAGCYNNRLYYTFDDEQSGIHYALFYSTTNKWKIDLAITEEYSDAYNLGYCTIDSDIISDCNGHWIAFNFEDTNGKIDYCDTNGARINDESDEYEMYEDVDISIAPYGYDINEIDSNGMPKSDNSGSNNNDSSGVELEWWSWLLIVVAILVVVIASIVIIVKMYKKNYGYQNNIQTGDDKNTYLLMK